MAFRCSIVLARVLTCGVSLLLAGCAASAPASTRMTVDDLNEMAAAMSQSLARSDAMGERTPNSPHWVISIDKALNLSSDIITESERWFVVQKVRSSMPIQAFSKQKNITFIIPAERYDMMRRDPRFGVKGEEGFGRAKPTHQMTATFRSVTRGSAEGRTDQYYCEFEILDISSPLAQGGGSPVWIDKFEYKRAAIGHIWD